MTIEVPLPDIAALPVWVYVTGGVWAWYLAAAVVVRGMAWAGVFRRRAERTRSCDVVPFLLGCGLVHEYDTLDKWRRVVARRTAVAVWVTSPVLLPVLVVITALWSSAHVMSLGLVPRPWSKGATA